VATKTPRAHKEKPFSTEANPRYFYRAPQYDVVVNHVFNTVVEHEGLAIVSGPIGSGKSTLFRYMVDQLNDELVDSLWLGVLYNPNYTTEFAFLKAICQEFDLPFKNHFGRQLEAFKEFLFAQHEAGVTVALLVDEAHRLTGAQLELVREFFNFSANDKFFLQVVLAGETVPLRKKLSYKPAIASRAAYIDTLKPLSLEDTAGLVRFRLAAARLPEDLFELEAIVVLHEASQGIPRTAVHLCRLALSALGDTQGQVTRALLTQVVAANQGVVTRNV
jgi:general secretion pathway protein A